MSKNSQTTDNSNRSAETFGVLLTHQLPNVLLSQGKLLTTLSVKYQGDGVLLILKVARSAEGPLVCFYGGRDAGHAGAKVRKDLYGDGLKWKTDDWAAKKLQESASAV